MKMKTLVSTASRSTQPIKKLATGLGKQTQKIGSFASKASNSYAQQFESLLELAMGGTPRFAR